MRAKFPFRAPFDLANVLFEFDWVGFQLDCAVLTCVSKECVCHENLECELPLRRL